MARKIVRARTHKKKKRNTSGRNFSDFRVRHSWPSGYRMRHASTHPGKWSSTKGDGEDRCGLEEKMSADGAGVRDRARATGPFSSGTARGDESKRTRNPRTALSARGPGIATS